MIIAKTGEYMMKKILFLICILTWIKPLQAANEYNFYFYGDNDEAKMEKKESTEVKGDPAKQDGTKILSDDEKIKQLADELAKKISERNQGASVTQATQTQPVFVEPSQEYYFLSDPKNYWGAGISTWTEHDDHDLMAFIQAKFLPYLTAQAAVPMTSSDHGPFDGTVYVGGMSEIHLTKNILANVLGGFVLKKKVISGTSSYRDGNSYKIETRYRDDDVPYVGAGFKWHVFKYVHLNASIHQEIGRGSISPLNSLHKLSDLSRYFSSDRFWTVGVSLNFL